MSKTSIRTVDTSSIIQYNKRRYSLPTLFRGEKFSISDCKTLRIYNEKYCRELEVKVTTIYPEDYIDDDFKVQDEVNKMLLVASLVGQDVYYLCKFIIRSKAHPYLSFRTLEAIFYLADKYGCSTTNRAAERALDLEKPYYYFIRKLLSGDGIYTL
jgi:hypothetical protein